MPPKEFIVAMPEQDETVLRDILGEPVILMPVSAIRAELRTIEDALPAPFSSRRKPTDAWLADAICAFCSCAPEPLPPSSDALRQKLAQLQEQQILPLRHQLNRVDLKLRWLKCAQGRDYPPPRMLAVHNVWYRRWASILDGMLIPAWCAMALL